MKASTSSAELRAVAPGVWATQEEPLFGGLSKAAGFLLERQEGNAFIYSSSLIEQHFDQIQALGGVDYVLLNHRDEASRSVTILAEQFNATVMAHSAELEACRQRGVEDVQALPEGVQVKIGTDLVAVHTPGHTPGVVMYLWKQQNKTRYLFSGDTLSIMENMGQILQFHPYEGNLGDLLNTLNLIAELDSDVVVPGLESPQLNAYAWTPEVRHEVVQTLKGQLTDSR